jgi:glycosyltransferase involved in cell wall biosynthesis
MRITFILPTVSMGGGIKVAAIYAKALAEKGHDVVLLSFSQSNTTIKRKIKSLIKGHGWPTNKQANSHLDGLGLDHRVLDHCRPIADVPDADVIIATWWETAEWVSTLNESKGVKIYFIQGHEIHEHLPVERSRATYYMPFHKIVVSNWLKKIMHTTYGDYDVDLVPNSVDHSQFFSCARDKQTLPTVGFLYSRSPVVKGIDITLEAIKNLRVTFPNLRVVAFGSHMPQDDILSRDGHIDFYCSPRQDKIRDIYSQCDVWLTASRNEGFNLPAMEAMACRTPVVSTKTGWPDEAVITGKNGVLVDIEDTIALTNGAASILSLSNEDWLLMSNNAYDTVASISWQVSASQFENVLKETSRRFRKPGND